MKDVQRVRLSLDDEADDRDADGRGLPDPVIGHPAPEKEALDTRSSEDHVTVCV